MVAFFERHFSLRFLLHSLAVTVLCACLLFYITFQARHIITGPVITLIEEPASVTSSSIITLRGTTENIISLTLNGRTIYTNDAGYFKETLVLPLGYSILTLTAADRYGRVRSLPRTYVRT